MAISNISTRLSQAAMGTAGSRRLLFMVGGAAVVAGGAYYFYSGPPAPQISTLPQIPGQTRTAQGGVPPTQEMAEALSKANAQRFEIASEQGGSAMPTVEAKLIKDVARPAEDALKLTDDDKVQRPAPPVIERPQIVAPTYAPAQPPVQVAMNGEPDKMVDEFRKFLDIKPEKYGPASVTYLYKGAMPGKPDLAAAQAQGAPRGATAESVGPLGMKMPLPGTIIYAQMVSTANSDTPGPVVAQIIQGDLAGATLIGAFQTQRDGLYISFKTLSMARNRDGDEINKAISVNAVAVDSVNVGTGIATDIDRHILQNVGIATAAAFAQGLGQAIATSGQSYTQSTLTGTTVINPVRTLKDQLYIAGGTAGGAGGQAIQRAYGNRPTTVTVAAGTPVGILFMPTAGIQ